MEKIIAVNIGSDLIKSVVIRKDKNDFILEDARIVEVSKDPDADKKSLLQQGIQEALKGLDLKHAQLICALDSPEIQQLNLVLPQMPEEELNEAVAWEIKNQAAAPKKDVIFAFAPQDEAGQANLKKKRLTVTVAKRAYIEDIKALFLEAGIAPTAIVSADTALECFFRQKKVQFGETATAVLDIGEDLTALFIYKKGALEFNRKLPLLTINAMAKSLTAMLVTTKGKVQLSLPEAKDILGRFGIPDAGSSELIADKISATQMLSLLRPKVEGLKTELERSFDYFRENFMENIQNIVLYGSGGQLKGLTEYLTKELEVTIERGTLPPNLIVDKRLEGEVDRFHVAIGAALSEGRWINLLFKETAARQKTRAFGMSAVAGVAVVCVALSLSLFFFWKQKGALSHQLEHRQKELSGLLQKFDQTQKERPLIEQMDQNPYWDQVFKELSNLLPEKMTLLELSMKDNMLRMVGQVEKTTDKGSDELLSGFMLTLEQKMFKNVRLIESRDDEENNALIKFEILTAVD